MIDPSSVLGGGNLLYTLDRHSISVTSHMHAMQFMMVVEALRLPEYLEIHPYHYPRYVLMMIIATASRIHSRK